MMATCVTNIDSFLAEDGTIDVSSKYSQLMSDSLGEGSLYAHTKTTLFYLFQNLQMSEPEKAKLIGEHIVNMSLSLSNTSMQTALQWAKEERDGSYGLAKIKADTEKALAEYELVKSQICKIDKETELACANVTSITAASIRENGRVSSYGSDGCSAETLENEGLKWHQARQSEADAYSRYADAYRKSGVVQVGADVADGVKKGLSGDEAGYTHQQEINAERLRISYEDSKRNHAANSAASMIGTMLSAEIAPNEADVQRWRDSLDWLNTSHSTTNQP